MLLDDINDQGLTSGYGSKFVGPPNSQMDVIITRSMVCHFPELNMEFVLVEHWNTKFFWVGYQKLVTIEYNSSRHMV